ncbi:MAG TPA: GDSL-type esterase/lipase family protein [Kiritimatiellia bacterium]|nr:GDSL-type esterase/lipase family protein [Kiritimatiellia bacterium]
MRTRRWVAVGLMLACACRAESLLRPNDRIIFVGDSITAQAVGEMQGYYHQFTNALKTAYPASRNEVIGLGFSGHTVFSWADSLEVKSRTESVPANTGGFDVHTAFARPADLVLVLLGMNDILRPTVTDEEASLRMWQDKYRELIRAIRKRVSPREFVLCEITPLTEDPLAPKNRVRDRMTQLVRELAREENCRVAETGGALFDVIARARKARQDYLVIPDTVHPRRPLGHTAIARGMAAALRDAKLTALFDARLDAAITGLRPAQATVTWRFKPQPGIEAKGGEQVYRIECYWDDGTGASVARVPTFSLEVPEGWLVAEAPVTRTEAVFTVRGTPERLQTPLTILAKAGEEVIRRTVQIPVPWRVVCGPENGGAWMSGRRYQPDNRVPFMETDLVAGKHFLEPFTDGGKSYGWQINTPCMDYTAGDDPNAVVPYSLTFGRENDVLYAVRWVYSAKARPVQIRLSHRTFSATLGFVVWINGERVMTADLNRSGKNQAVGQATLKAGWNRLLVRNDHLQWQRQFACALLPVEGDALDDLRYAIRPQSVSPSP